MSRRLHSRLLALVLCASVLGAPAAAHAERVVTEDAAGDVVSVTFADPDGAGEEEQFTPAPESTVVDITRTVVDHRANRLRVSVRYRDLRAVPWHVTVIRVRTPERRFWIQVERTSKRPKGVGSFSGGRASSSTQCRGLRWSIDPDRESVTASLPTACLGSPRWVQVGAGAVSFAQPMTESESVDVLADDGHRPGLVSDKDLRLGPKVHRG